LTLCDRIVYRGYNPRQKQADKLEINCIILAGGKSLRFGHDKISEKFGTASLLEHVISRVDPLSKKIFIVTAKERSFGQLAKHPKINVVSDILPGQGSLGGIYTGLVNSDSFHNLVVAADMPFLSEPLLKYMVKVADGFDFILPHIKEWYEPLHAIYSKNCVGPIKSILEQGNKVIVELFNYVKVRYVEAEEVDRFDPKHLSFFNINTQEDLERAINISGGAGV
jgi:molybdopterin-guanine dinucleotide biosynthesis protein A